MSETAMATLQHALARGLELVFQLEEGETLTEPVPSRDKRRAVLAFEASEGGAGVLGRLSSEPQALARVARAALELMHYHDIDRAIAAGDPSLLTPDPEADCVKGCYRCLLSYYTQAMNFIPSSVFTSGGFVNLTTQGRVDWARSCSLCCNTCCPAPCGESFASGLPVIGG
jgi:hypothetical protein